MRLGILTILLAMILTADAQIAATLQIAGTSSNQAVLSVSSNTIFKLYNLQSATSLTAPVHWNSVSTTWGSSGILATVPVAGSQQFFRIVQSIPVFELAIFYNMDMEINPGSALTINGPVHCNKNIYATGASSGSPLTFTSIVESSQQVNQFSSPLDPRSPARIGNVVFSNTNNNPLSNAAPLYLPFYFPAFPNNGAINFAPILNLPPAGTDPTSTLGQSYIYNEADIIISNSATANLSVYYQNQNSALPQTLVPWDVTNIISHISTNCFYSFVTNVLFYDYRESKTVEAVQFDVAKFSTWLTNTSGGWVYENQNLTGYTSKGHGINIVYIYNAITNNNSQLPAIRVVNGQQLPSLDGLTIATPSPLYVLGNYNTTTNGVNFSTALGDTTNTYPAALMGDAITILSANWSDAYNPATPLSSRNPVSTIINAATLQGIVPSNGTYYSGGVENFLRLLENWNATTTLTYNGSIAVFFQSQYATNFWNNSYYGVPKRAWGFDPYFLLGRLPPGTPEVVNQASP